MKPGSKLFFAIPPGIGFPRGSEVKNPTTMQETWVQSLGWEDTLEKGMATHSSIFAWRIPWTEQPGRPQFMGLQSQTPLSNFAFFFVIEKYAGL